MIRFLVRFIGLWLLAGAFVVLVIDGTRSVSISKFVYSPLRGTWDMIAGDTLSALQQKFAGGLFERPFEFLLSMPFFVVLTVLGLFFVLIGRRKQQDRVGYSSRD